MAAAVATGIAIGAFLGAARAAIGATNAFFTAVLGFDDICRCASDNQKDHENGNPICNRHHDAKSSIKLS